MKDRLGFIGLGIMGGAIAQNLVNAGFAVTVWNRTESKVKALVDSGAIKGESPKDVGSNCDILLTCVTNDKALEQILLGENDALTGESKPKLVIDFSTVPPATILRLHEEMKKIKFL